MRCFTWKLVSNILWLIVARYKSVVAGKKVFEKIVWKHFIHLGLQTVHCSADLG